ncbi:hypothetical protein A2U01_0092605, partial [Trifolium medium]|nr:hypothetical protein [Trifolium medium]
AKVVQRRRRKMCGRLVGDEGRGGWSATKEDVRRLVDEEEEVKQLIG